MRKKVLFFLFCFSISGGAKVNAIDKLGNVKMRFGDYKETQELIKKFDSDLPLTESRLPYSFNLPSSTTLSYANDKGLLQENKWYWVTPINLPHRARMKDTYEKYQDLVIYEEPQSSTIPMQFIRVGEKYLPFLRLEYGILSAKKINPENIRNLPHYLSLLKEQNAVYIDSISGEIIPRNKAEFSCCYMFIKMVDEKPEAVEVVRVLFQATVYNYYPSGRLKSRRDYHPYKGEVSRGLAVSENTYGDNDKIELLAKLKSTPVSIEDITTKALVPRFKENQKIPPQLFNK